MPSEIAYDAAATSPSDLKVAGGRCANTSGGNIKRNKLADAFHFNALSTSPDAGKLLAVSDSTTASTMRWGFQVRPDKQRLRCLKLLLDPAQPLPKYVSLDDLQEQLVGTQKNVGTVVAEYMRALFDHAKEVLNRRYGEFFMSTTSLKVVLTVPAVWSDAAQDATLRAAKAAGMGQDITLIFEPEAAAVYALQAIQPNHLKVGHNFVVVDAGGGTVDLITYGIRQLAPLRLDEVVRGSGGCCGAAFLNILFEDFVRQKLGDDSFDEIRLNKPRSWMMYVLERSLPARDTEELLTSLYRALKYFEDYVKRHYDPAEDDLFNIPFPGIPDNADAGIDQGFLCMDTADVGSLFKPVIDDILTLVEGQMRSVRAMDKTVNALILVGGFGQSECLLKCLRSRFAEAQPRVEVMQPVNAWTAVVRGAVLRGLEGEELVLNRKARRHYGVSASHKFNRRKHSLDVKYWDKYDEKWKAADQMTWFISKGATVSSTEPVTFPFYRNCQPGQGRTSTIELLVCDDDEAPRQHNVNPGAKTRVLCQMMPDLDKVPGHLWSDHVNASGLRFQSLDYDIGMQVESGGLRFDFRVDDVVYGKVTATFD